MEKVSFWDKVCLPLATLFGVGFIPLGPGTASCVVALLFVFLIKSQVYFFIFTVIVLGLSFLVSGPAEKIFAEKDSKKIVIDDFVGLLISFLFIPRTIEFIICGFFLFRMLDMLKIPPANKLEELEGAKGIVGDDVVAGIYTNITLQIVRLLLKITA